MTMCQRNLTVIKESENSVSSVARWLQ